MGRRGAGGSAQDFAEIRLAAGRKELRERAEVEAVRR